MKYIVIETGERLIVDDDFQSTLTDLRWQLDKHGYPLAYMPQGGKRVYLHNVVIGARTGFIVDHINGNPLDNQSSNLRFCTHAENLRNQKISKNNRSGYKGIYWRAAAKKWGAEICVDRIKHRLGTFATKDEAALAYNEAALKYHGEFARLNIIDERPE